VGCPRNCSAIAKTLQQAGKCLNWCLKGPIDTTFQSQKERFLIMFLPTTQSQRVVCALKDVLLWSFWVWTVLFHWWSACTISVFFILVLCLGLIQSNSNFIHIVEVQSWPCFVSNEKQFALCFVRMKSNNAKPIRTSLSNLKPLCLFLLLAWCCLCVNSVQVEVSLRRQNAFGINSSQNKI
jgi:hypothetical protein